MLIAKWIEHSLTCPLSAAEIPPDCIYEFSYKVDDNYIILNGVKLKVIVEEINKDDGCTGRGLPIGLKKNDT